MVDELTIKREKLETIIKSYGKIIIACSGGLDSMLLTLISKSVLGKNNVIAVTVDSPTLPAIDRDLAGQLQKKYRVNHKVLALDPIDEIEGFKGNPLNRCYLCKKATYLKIFDFGEKQGITTVADGTNSDDISDYRPGLTAAKEMKVVSPFLDSGIGKKEIHQLARDMGLDFSEKPSSACLSSRFNYYDEITKTKLERVDRSENLIRSLGIATVRVRIHGEIARVEVGENDFARITQSDIREKVDKALISFGFSFVCLDMSAYRKGSMNFIL